VKLKGQVCVVTGAGRGIGRGIAKEQARAGGRIALLGRSADVEAVAAGINAEGGDAKAYRVDILDAAALATTFAAIENGLGPIDLLTNNAASFYAIGPIWEVDPDAWWGDIELNIRGTFLCCRAVLPGMLARGAGSIVNIASAHSFKIIPHCFPYPVAKHALVGLTRALAIEYAARGVRVNAIAPGYIDTPIAEAYWATFPDPAAERARAENMHPPKRIGRPEEVAHTALFLASDEAPFINAETIVIDGGRSALYHD